MNAYDDVIKRWLHNPANEGWKNAAACRGTSSELWFPTYQGRRAGRKVRILIDTAKLICRSCSVQRECLAWAVATDERYGIYGGMTEQERARFTGKRPE